MRNIKVYPITGDEIYSTINQIPSPEGMCGDIRPMIKHALLQYFTNTERMKELLEQLRIK